MSAKDHTPLFAHLEDEAPTPAPPVEYREIPECPGYRFGDNGSAWTTRTTGGRWSGRAADRPTDGAWSLLTVFADKKGFNRRIWVRFKRAGFRGVGKVVSLSEMITLAFYGPCPEGMEWRRIDGDATNDRADNLEWGSWQDDLARGEKRCAKCRVIKPFDRYWPEPRAKDGYEERCRDCLCADNKVYRSIPENKAKIKILEARTKLKYFYGITQADYDRLLDRQGGVCAICGRPPLGGANTKRLHVDHDHAPGGAVRGLLCSRCNTALGAFGDTVEGLMRAVDYLRHPPNSTPMKEG